MAKSEEKAFGVHSEVGKLHKVMVCAPGKAHQRLTPSNCDQLLFDDVLWVDNAKRDHFDFMTKMRDRGVEVLEMHNLLAETLAVPEAKAWILDHQVVANEVGTGLVDEVRSYLEGLGDRELAETLIGGLSTYEFPESSDAMRLVRDAAGVNEYLLPPLPNTLYTRDTTCWIYGGVTLNPLYWPARREETILTTNLPIPTCVRMVLHHLRMSDSPAVVVIGAGVGGLGGAAIGHEIARHHVDRQLQQFGDAGRDRRDGDVHGHDEDPAGPDAGGEAHRHAPGRDGVCADDLRGERRSDVPDGAGPRQRPHARQRRPDVHLRSG